MNKRLDSCWDLNFQDMLLDVAATVAATEPQAVVFQKQRLEAQPVLSLSWAMHDKVEDRSNE